MEILLVASCYRKRDKFQPDGPQLAWMQTLLFKLLYTEYEIMALLQCIYDVSVRPCVEHFKMFISLFLVFNVTFAFK